MVELLATLWKKFPDWRLGQLVFNANAAARATGDLYSTEDEELEQGLRKLLGRPHPDGNGEALAA